MENGDTMILLSIVSHCASIYLQAGRKKEVAKEGMPHLLNRKIFGFLFLTAATPNTPPNEKEI